jgi:ribosomal protein S18 acetylase RimI-like enzyme
MERYSNISNIVQVANNSEPVISVAAVTRFVNTELDDLIEATEATLMNTKGFSIGLNSLPPRDHLENYFKGILLIPERELVIGKFDGVIAGSIQIIRPNSSNQASSFAVSVENHFVAPWARGYGMAKALLIAAENIAREQNFSLIKLSVRATLEAAIKLYESLNYRRWGTLEKYEMVGNEIVAGHFYYKDL